jgi:hypothetical protein
MQMHIAVAVDMPLNPPPTCVFTYMPMHKYRKLVIFKTGFYSTWRTVTSIWKNIAVCCIFS